MNRWLETLTDPLLLRRAEAKAKSYGNEQRTRIATLHRAARTRARAAAELRTDAEAPAALALLREAFVLSANMLLVARGELTEDVALLGVDSAWQAIADAYPEHAGLAELLGTTDPLAPDKLDPARVEQSRALLESLVHGLLREAEPRTQRAIKFQRILRLLLVAGAFVALVIAFVVWLTRPSNVALGKTVTASSRYAGSPNPSNLVDGNTTAAFGVHTNIEDAPWIELDLGKTRALTRVVIYSRTDGYEQESLPLSLDSSEDHANWNRVATRREVFSMEKPWKQTLGGIRARWLRLTLEKKGYISLGEIEAYER